MRHFILLFILCLLDTKLRACIEHLRYKHEIQAGGLSDHLFGLSCSRPVERKPQTTTSPHSSHYFVLNTYKRNDGEEEQSLLFVQ